MWRSIRVSNVAGPRQTDTDNEGRSERQWGHSGKRLNSSLTRMRSFVNGQEGFQPERVARLRDFVRGRKENFHETIYGSPWNPPSPRILSSELEKPDAVEELIQIYRNMGANLYQEPASSPSICTTSCEWTGEILRRTKLTKHL
jgi:hypothetical protein